MRLKAWMILMAFLATLQRAQTFTAYDCQHPNATFTSIDLTEPQQCPDPINDFEEDELAYFQVIQLDSLTPVTAYQCQVIMTKKATRCGTFSIDFGHTYPVYKKMVEITPDQCRTAVNTGILQFANQKIRIRHNQRVTHRYFSHGKRFISGYCETTNFHSEGEYFEDSYEEVFLEVKLTRIGGHIDESAAIITLRNGLRAHALDRVLQDSIEGVIVWDVPETHCQQKVAELYYGKGTVKRRKERKGFMESIVMIRDTKKQRFAGFVLRSMRPICGAECYAVQGEEGLAVCMARPEGGKALENTQTLVNARNDLAQLELKTQVMFMHTSLHLHLRDQFAMITDEMCKIDRRTLYTRLQSIASANNPYALDDLFGKGVSIQHAGATAYVTKCVPVEVKPVTQQNCSIEIPVRRVGRPTDTTIEYVDPMSFILKQFPVIVPCSVLMPIRWKIGNEWTCSTPAPRLCKAPAKLNVTFGLQPKLDLFIEAVGQGLFTQEQITQHRLFVQTQETRTAVSANAANAAVLHSNDGHLGFAVLEEDLPALAMGISYYIFPLIYYAGNYWIYIWGFLVGIGLFKVFAGCLIRSFLIYRRKGCGWWMLSALWSTAFLFFAYPIQIIRRAVSALIEPIQNLPGEEDDMEKQALNQRHHQEETQRNYASLAAQLEELRKLQDVLMNRYDSLILERQEDHSTPTTIPADDPPDWRPPLTFGGPPA